jgi:hypothetical protein
MFLKTIANDFFFQNLKSLILLVENLNYLSIGQNAEPERGNKEYFNLGLTSTLKYDDISCMLNATPIYIYIYKLFGVC